MPLSRYGVLKGPLFIPTEQTEQGTWFHGIFYVAYPGTNIPRECATDFSSATADNVQYKIFPNLKRDLFSGMIALADGYFDLASNANSGALDYVRSPLLGPGGCLTLLVGLSKALFGATLSDGWIVSDGDNAVAALQQLLNSRPQKLYVFGEPFFDASPVTNNGVQSQSGMHNIHMNQGDPPLSPDGKDHQTDDGIWQDGATIFEAANGTLTAFCNKFVSQTFDTNDQGLPA
jgi:hypothetical protein